jgi:predicted acylesterase/phospholipase RssA
MGALIGALYALGASPDEMARLDIGGQVRRAVRLRISANGPVDPAPLAELVDHLVGKRTFAETAIPLAITAIDLSTQERITLRDGPVASAVLASMMVPAVLPPVLVGERWLHDPGLVEGVPLEAASAFGADTVLAVSADLAPLTRSRDRRRGSPSRWFFTGSSHVCAQIGRWTQWPWASQLGRTFAWMSRPVADCKAVANVIWLQPSFGRMSSNHFGGSERAIQLGEAAVHAAVPELLRLGGALD